MHDEMHLDETIRSGFEDRYRPPSKIADTASAFDRKARPQQKKETPPPRNWASDVRGRSASAEVVRQPKRHKVPPPPEDFNSCSLVNVDSDLSLRSERRPQPAWSNAYFRRRSGLAEQRFSSVEHGLVRSG